MHPDRPTEAERDVEHPTPGQHQNIISQLYRMDCPSKKACFVFKCVSYGLLWLTGIFKIDHGYIHNVGFCTRNSEQ